MFHSGPRRFEGNNFYHTCLALIHGLIMACCCPKLFKRKKKHTFNPDLDVKIEVNEPPKITKNDQTELEIQMGKRTSMENMNCSLDGSIDEPLENQVGLGINASRMSINTQLTQEVEAKVERELTFEEEVYKELENEQISNAGDFVTPKVEQKDEIRYCLGEQYTEPIVDALPKVEKMSEIRISTLPSLDETEKQEQIRLSRLPDLPGSPSKVNSETPKEDMESKNESKGDDNVQEIRMSKLPILDTPEDQKEIRLSDLPSMDIPEVQEEDLETKLQNLTSLENPNYQNSKSTDDPKVEQNPIVTENENHESGFLSVELNPLDSKFRSSVKILVTEN